MSKESMNKLVKYSNDLKNKLSEKNLPEKHKDHPAQYKIFLERELQGVTNKIESLKDLGKK